MKHAFRPLAAQHGLIHKITVAQEAMSRTIKELVYSIVVQDMSRVVPVKLCTQLQLLNLITYMSSKKLERNVTIGHTDFFW